MTAPPQKTLIIRLSSAGDIVLSSLLVRAMHARFPACQIDFCVKEEFAELVRFNPNISHVIAFPTSGTLSDLRQLRRTLACSGYDLLIDIHDSLRSRYLCFGAANVVRINKRKLLRFLLIRLNVNWYDRFTGAPSVALRYLEPVQHYGVEDDGKGLELFLPPNAGERVAALLHSERIGPTESFIGICPSAKHENKMWLKERFAEVAASLASQDGSPIVLFGSEAERPRCREIELQIHAVRGNLRALNLAGRLSFVETAALMDKCSIIITNDSGLMHIAAARKRKIVAVFGPTVRELGFFPFGTESIVVENNNLTCRPCTHIGLPACPKGHFKCMNEITAREVFAAAETLLPSSRS
jgi:heptosyltransferase-2